ncbi:MAG: hypothetical protein DMG57_40625 [Acidobacteria bacterium]|nr:MAG: hypothetical protein DMG57_40625 [Acidobacteriota bacterium]
MLEGVFMSVWPSASSPHFPALCGSEGELVSISVIVEPRDLEDLLESLALLDFPINPQIYHDASLVYVSGDGSQVSQPATIVEFPAYAARLPNVRAVLESRGLKAGAVSVNPMLAEIHSGEHIEPAPAGAAHICRILRKRTTVAAEGKY